MKARYYGGPVGRFMSPDPVGVDPSSGANFNRYWYGNNNPVTNHDSDGRACDSLSGGGCGMTADGRYTSTGSVDFSGALEFGLDQTPIIGDLKGFYDAYQDPIALNIILAVVTVIPGTDALKLLKHVDPSLAADARRVWTTTSDEIVLPPGKDFNLVPTATPNPRDSEWIQIHSSHAHNADARAHAHQPESGTGKREDAPLAE